MTARVLGIDPATATGIAYRGGTAMLSFFVYATPKPGGSKRAFYNKAAGRAIIIDDCKGNKDWRNAVVYAAREAIAQMGTRTPLLGPLFLSVEFHMPRPKAHYNAKGELKPNAPTYCEPRPDATKLLRSTEDALSDAGVWRDDAQVCEQAVTKRYATASVGAQINVWELEG